jgi:hypothetical protein
VRLGLLALCAGAALSAAAHEGHTDRAPWDACAASALGEACAWESAPHERREGTCRQIGGGLMCVRHKPVTPAPQPLAWRPWAVAAGLGAAALTGVARAQRQRAAGPS